MLCLKYYCKIGFAPIELELLDNNNNDIKKKIVKCKNLYLDVLLVFIIRVQVVGANSNTQSGGRLTITAVSSSNNPGVTDQGTTAHERTIRSTTEQHDLVGELTVVSILTTDNLTASTAQGSGAGVLQQLGCIRSA